MYQACESRTIVAGRAAGNLAERQLSRRDPPGQLEAAFPSSAQFCCKLSRVVADHVPTA
jgi:hypothetical protein